MTKALTLPNTSRFRHFDWEKAKTFYYIAQFKSFTKGAEFLRTSQPALSRSISSLERQLGCPLFIRQSRGVTLTRKGEELQRIIKITFEHIKEFTHNAKKIEGGELRTLRIGLPKSLMSPVLNILKDYQRSRPYLTLELVEDIDTKEMSLLDLDMALRPFQKGLSSVEQQALVEVDQNLFSSSVIISQEPERWVFLCCVIPSVLKEDEELKDMYQALRSGFGDDKKAETNQREAA